jgi:DNA-binding transcriptional MerR regulator
MGTITVSTLAKQVGLRPDTIRYYERAGLLPPGHQILDELRHLV